MWVQTVISLANSLYWSYSKTQQHFRTNDKSKRNKYNKYTKHQCHNEILRSYTKTNYSFSKSRSKYRLFPTCYTRIPFWHGSNLTKTPNGEARATLLPRRWAGWASAWCRPSARRRYWPPAAQVCCSWREDRRRASSRPGCPPRPRAPRARTAAMHAASRKRRGASRRRTDASTLWSHTGSRQNHRSPRDLARFWTISRGRTRDDGVGLRVEMGTPLVAIIILSKWQSNGLLRFLS